MNLLFILAENTVKGTSVLSTVAPQLKTENSIAVALNKMDQKGSIQTYCENGSIRHFIVGDNHLKDDE